MTDQTRIVLADDHPIVLNGLRNLLESESDVVIIGEVWQIGSVDALLRAASRQPGT